jgi:hypothetical protein
MTSAIKKSLQGYFKTLAVLSLTACVSASPAGEKVRTTSNPEVVRGCKFLGNVRATSGWGGPAGTGIAGHNTDVALREKTARLGGNVVYVVESGIHASGEAYLCEAPKSTTTATPGNR